MAIIFMILLNYFVFKAEAISIYNEQHYIVTSQAEKILIPFLTYVPYFTLFASLLIIVIQSYQLKKWGFNLFKALFVSGISMLVLLYILDWLVLILNKVLIYVILIPFFS